MPEPLSRERVLSAAVTLADTDGLPALTMRRLAAALGVGAMSLYHYFPGKNSLFDSLLETVIAEVGDAADSIGDAGDWRATLRQRFLAARKVMLRHPWAPELMGKRRGIPANVYLYYEKILATLIAAGFSYRIAHRALHSFGSMPLGFVQELFAPSPDDSADSDSSEEEFAALAASMPHIAAMVAAESHSAADPTLGWCDSQTEFEFTLDLLLDGLERFRG